MAFTLRVPRSTSGGGTSLPTDLRAVLMAALPDYPDASVITDGDWKEGSASPGNGARAQNASGSMTVPVKGNMAVASATNPAPSDPAALTCTFPFADVAGMPVGGDTQWSGWVILDTPDGAPLVGDNVAFLCFIWNQSGVGGLARDGLIFGIEWTATVGAPRVFYCTVKNGVVGDRVSGAPLAAIRGVRAAFTRQPGLTGSIVPSLFVFGVDVNGEPVTGGSAAPLLGTTAIGTDQWFGGMAVVRTTADADAITVKPRLRVSRPVQAGVPAKFKRRVYTKAPKAKKKLNILVIGNSTLIGRTIAATPRDTPNGAMRILESLRLDPARAPYQSDDIPYPKYRGVITGTAAHNLEFHESGLSSSNLKSGCLPSDVVNGTNGQFTLASTAATLTSYEQVDVVIFCLTANGVLADGSNAAAVIAVQAALVAEARTLWPGVKVICVQAHRLNAGNGFEVGINTLRALETTAALGCDIVVSTDSITAAHFVGPTDPHLSLPANPDLVTSHRGRILQPNTIGMDRMAMLLWDAIYPGYARPLLPGETWI